VELVTQSVAEVTPSGGSDPLVLVTAAADQTRQLAGLIALSCEPGDVLLLAGDLGAGKTTFAQGFGAALGITEPITSPTFVLVRQYPLDGKSGLRVLLHADVYRLDHLHEVVDLGLGQLVDDGGVALVEWGDAAAPVLGAGALHVRLDPEVDLDGLGDDHRRITVEPVDPTDGGWARRWAALAESLARWTVVQ
jgi:tRNA threonylcarbamoyladenosine biosynthesis protein TsaE